MLRDTSMRDASLSAAADVRRQDRVRRPVLVPAAVTAAAVVTWIVTVDRMQGMDAGPGTNLGGLGWFAGVWATMMAAMMLPSLTPTTVGVAGISARQQRLGRSLLPAWAFISGYLAVWTAYGLLAYGIFRVIDAAHIHALSWQADGPLIAGSAIVAAGLYQLSPLKRSCLRHCRSHVDSVPGGRRVGWSGSVCMGLEHGVFCVGCCWGLMLILFALGVMSVVWMLMVAGLIFAEKVLPFGERLSRWFAVAFVVVGIWVAAAPSSVPGLTQPGSPQAMRAMRAMRAPGGHEMKKGAVMQNTHTMGTERSGSTKMK